MEIQEKAWVDKLERSGPYMAYGAGQVNAWTREPLSYFWFYFISLILITVIIIL